MELRQGQALGKHLSLCCTECCWPRQVNGQILGKSAAHHIGPGCLAGEQVLGYDSWRFRLINDRASGVLTGCRASADLERKGVELESLPARLRALHFDILYARHLR